MMPNMRSVVAQCYYRGGRSMGPRRNFSSSIESKKDGSNSLYTTMASGFPKWTSVGMCLYFVWDIKNAIPKWKKMKEEQKLVEQRQLELPWEALLLRLRELGSKK